MQRILIVEDEPSIAEVVALYLKRAGFEATVAPDGQVALEEIGRSLPDLVVLDLMLPRVDGLEVMRRLRAASETPVIMLTARRSEVDRIAGLEMGADDYVIKPFSAQELVSRVRAVLRRSQASRESQSADEQPLVYDGLTIDPSSRAVLVAGSEQSLTAREFDLLLTLARRPHHVFRRTQLLQSVWGTAEFIDPSTVTVHIRRLREKLELDPGQPRLIRTVWGVGYRFEP
jgi:two-component system, OmpR family, response regulator ResD